MPDLEGILHNVKALYRGLPRRWRHIAGENANSGRFAGPVGPKEADYFTLFDLKRNISYGPDMAIKFCQSFGFDHFRSSLRSNNSKTAPAQNSRPAYCPLFQLLAGVSSTNFKSIRQTSTSNIFHANDAKPRRKRSGKTVVASRETAFFVFRLPVSATACATSRQRI